MRPRKKGKTRKRNRTVIKRAKRVIVLNRSKATKKRAGNRRVVRRVNSTRKTAKKARPARRRNKVARITAADIAKFPPRVQQQLRAQMGKIEEREERATTPAQKQVVAKSRRSFLSRLGTRLRLIGQTKKIKVSARDLGRCPRKKIKVRARHETDALAKARAKLGGRFDQVRVGNSRRRKARGSRRRNVGHTTPKARALRQKFTGMKSRKTTVMTAPQGTPRNLAKLGRLISIKAQRGVIKPARKNPGAAVWLCADAQGKLHLCTTGERLIEGPARSFGEVREIEYETAKPHLGHKRPTIFFHKMGEEGGRRPELVADGQGGLKFKGGSYRVSSRGLED